MYTFFTGHETINDQEFQGEEFFHSSSLGVEMVQRETKREMVSNESYGDFEFDAYDVDMESVPFSIILPRRSDDDVVQIAAWTDDSIFSEVGQGKPKSEVPFFSGGTGFAAGRFSIPILYLSRDGHNYYRGDRLEHVSEHEHGISISKLWIDGTEEEIHLTQVDDPIYMVVYMDLDRDGVLDTFEFEYFVLRF